MDLDDTVRASAELNDEDRDFVGQQMIELRDKSLQLAEWARGRLP